jgi:hypothetical protein
MQIDQWVDMDLTYLREKRRFEQFDELPIDERRVVRATIAKLENYYGLLCATCGSRQVTCCRLFLGSSSPPEHFCMSCRPAGWNTLLTDTE